VLISPVRYIASKKNPMQVWVEFLKPMPTARYWLSAATTQSFIIASGGITGAVGVKAVPCLTVEVYSTETFQWYTADPLPARHFTASGLPSLLLTPATYWGDMIITCL